MNIQSQVADMLKLSLAQLRVRYVEVIGEAPRTRNRIQLVRRIAWRLQARQHGDLSERANARAEELAITSEFRLGPPTDSARWSTANGHGDNHRAQPRGRTIATRGMPMPGASISRQYKGKHIQVTVLADGFDYDGTRYSSLSAVAKAVTGSHWNGRLFFGLKASPKEGSA